MRSVQAPVTHPHATGVAVPRDVSRVPSSPWLRNARQLSVAEKAVVCPVQEKPAAQSRVFKYRLWDAAQKTLYLRNDQLVAGYLQGPNSELEEKISWVPSRSFEREKFPVILGIQDGHRSLACGTGTLPALQLEDVNITELSRDSENIARFTFFRSYKDGMWRFESAANRGWLLCTATQSNEPLGLATGPDAEHIVDFYFQQC